MTFLAGFFCGVVLAFAASTVFSLLLLGAYSRSLRKLHQRGTTFASVEAWEAAQAKERVMTALKLHGRGIRAYIARPARFIQTGSRN